jgi:hypothetical protein
MQLANLLSFAIEFILGHRWGLSSVYQEAITVLCNTTHCFGKHSALMEAAHISIQALKAQPDFLASSGDLYVCSYMMC